MNFSRRDFLKSSASFLTAVALSPKQIFSNDSANRDLQMLVLGDSVMWGQGLLEKDKFWFLTKEWIEAETSRKVSAHIQAHSGATILWRNDQKYPKDRVNTLNGELNVSTPTIEQQVLNAVEYYKTKSLAPQDVDLILINGGANDIGIFNLINPSISRKWIQRRTERVFGQDMLGVLRKVSGLFPNARIVVTGYYPVVSAQTPRERICLLIDALVNEKLINKIYNLPGLGRLLRFFGLRKNSSNVCSIEWLEKRVAETIVELTALSEIWQRQSNFYLREAVNKINSESPATEGNNRRAIFVELPFAPENAYAAPQTYLWQITDGGKVFGSYRSNDMFYQLRHDGKVCDCKHVRLKGFELETCYIAGTGHPNIEGAKKYAEAIRQEFKEILPLTGWRK